MNIDWSQPVICANGIDAEPLFDGQGRVQACRVGSVVYAQSAFEKLGLRNVAPKPTQYEGYLVLGGNGSVSGPFRGPVPRTSVLDKGSVSHQFAWNSDGSPVGDDRTAEYKIDRDWLSQKYSEMITDRDHWKAKANEALALLTQRNDAYEELLRKAEALQAVRAYQNAEPATSDSHEAVVDAEEDRYQSYAPIKRCRTCRWENSQSVCGAKDCLGKSQNYRGWEKKDD